MVSGQITLRLVKNTHSLDHSGRFDSLTGREDEIPRSAKSADVITRGGLIAAAVRARYAEWTLYVVSMLQVLSASVLQNVGLAEGRLCVTWLEGPCFLRRVRRGKLIGRKLDGCY